MTNINKIKINRVVIILTIFISSFTFQSCNDDDEIEKPKTEKDAEIILFSPMKDIEIYKDEILKVRGVIKADFTMHGYEINIVRKRDKQIVDSKYEHIHKKEIDLEFDWKNTLPINEEMYVEIIAHLGHNNHEQKFYRRNFWCIGDK